MGRDYRFLALLILSTYLAPAGFPNASAKYQLNPVKKEPSKHVHHLEYQDSTRPKTNMTIEQ